MVDACRDAGVLLMEAFMYRQHPSWIAARSAVASRAGSAGSRPSTAGSRTSTTTRATSATSPTSGGGALYDIGCYSVNLSRMLFASEPTRVQASITRDPALGVDILTSAILDFEGGVATFTCSTRAESDQRVDIYGTEGRISIEIPFNIPPDRPTRIFVIAGGDPPVAPATETLTFDTADPYACEADRFADAVLDGVPLPVEPEDAVANMRVIDAIFAAA